MKKKRWEVILTICLRSGFFIWPLYLAIEGIVTVVTNSLSVWYFLLCIAVIFGIFCACVAIAAVEITDYIKDQMEEYINRKEKEKQNG